MKLRLAIWLVVTALVVLAARTIAYALAPQSALLDALAHGRVGPDVTVPLVVGSAAAAALAAAVLWLAAMAVRERLLLEGRRVLSPPRLRPCLLAVRALGLFLASSFAFAMVESTIHYEEGLGWHGLHCLVGPVHRDAIPILAALSVVAVAVHGAVEHLFAWTRRLIVQLAARAFPATPLLPRSLPAISLRSRRAAAANGARGPPARSPSSS